MTGSTLCMTTVIAVENCRVVDSLRLKWRISFSRHRHLTCWEQLFLPKWLLSLVITLQLHQNAALLMRNVVVSVPNRLLRQFFWNSSGVLCCYLGTFLHFMHGAQTRAFGEPVMTCNHKKKNFKKDFFFLPASDCVCCGFIFVTDIYHYGDFYYFSFA